MINKKTPAGLDFLKILKNVDQTSQTSSDQTLPDPLQITNFTKTPDTETLPDSPLIFNDSLIPDTEI